MRFFLILSFLLVINEVTAQDASHKADEAEAQAREELNRKREAMMRAYERDPKRFMDSVSRINEEQIHQEALKRLERYEANTALDTLTEIDLSHAGLLKIPAFVFEATSIEKLNLDYNKIAKLPRKLKKLENLKRIEWNNNQVDKRQQIQKIPQLEKLYMVGNRQEKMPNLDKTENLRLIDFSGNQLARLPIKTLSRPDSLKEVIIKENPILLGEDKYELLSNIEILKLNKCGLESVDQSFYQMPSLRELQMQENKLTNLPDGISQMSRLSKVSFYKCQLESLPSDFFEIPSLVIADLYYNQLRTIPENIDQAEKIEVLFLSHNQIFEVPESIGELHQLEELYLHNNKLSYLPETLANLSKLKVLRVNNNLLQTFPNQILELTQLRDLDLDDNLLTELPSEISNLNQLKLLTFDGNQINFRDPSNKDFMKAINELQRGGTICKPAIDMNYIDASGQSVEIDNK